MPARRLVSAAPVALALFAGGCGLFGWKGAPARIEVEVVASERLNPDEQGQSLPTVVRIFQLRGAAKLEAADFDPLYRRPKEVLGEDLLQLEEVTLSPGQPVRRQLDRDPAARVVAVVGLFRKPSGLSWRAWAEIPASGKGAPVAFLAEGYRIERR
jgi:type VI secretion system protein VasD